MIRSIYSHILLVHFLFTCYNTEKPEGWVGVATMKDIARLAGVSHGTVSNVINKRGNVSVDKIRLVEQAAKKLGYSANAQARLLRQERANTAAIILPNIHDAAYQTLYETLVAHLTGAGYTTALLLSDNLAFQEERCIESALSSRPACIIAASCLPNPPARYDMGVPVCLIDCDAPAGQLPANIRCFSFHYAGIAAEIAARLASLGCRSVACFVDARGIPADRALMAHLPGALATQGLQCEVYSSDHKLMVNASFEILRHEPRFDAVVAGNERRKEALLAAAAFSNATLPHIVSLSVHRTLPAADALRYSLDYSAMAMRVVETITGPEEEGREAVLLPGDGFAHMPSPRHAAGTPARELTLVTLASPSSGALLSLAPDFYTQTGIQLKVVALPHTEMYQSLTANAFHDVDLLRMDTVWLSRFERQMLQPLDRDDPRIAAILSGLLPSIAAVYTRNERLYSLPFDTSTQLLYYRKDLFEDAKLRRQYYEIYKRPLAVPGDYRQYAEVASFFTRACNASSPTQYGTTMTYGSAAVAACDFLPWLKGMGGGIFDWNGYLAVNTPVVREALEAYLHMGQYASPAVNYWWVDSMQAFAAGQSAIASVFLNHASPVFNGNHSVVVGKVGSAPLPGGTGLLGGGCIGISRQSEKVEDCHAFLEWVYSERIANLLTLLGGLSPCSSVYQNEEILGLYPWLRNYSDCFITATRRNISPLYPHFDDYQFELQLGIAVRNTAMGIMPVAAALERLQAWLDDAYPAR